MDQKEHQELCQFLQNIIYHPNVLCTKGRSNFRRKASGYRIQDGTRLFKVFLCLLNNYNQYKLLKETVVNIVESNNTVNFGFNDTHLANKIVVIRDLSLNPMSLNPKFTVYNCLLIT